MTNQRDLQPIALDNPLEAALRVEKDKLEKEVRDLGARISRDEKRLREVNRRVGHIHGLLGQNQDSLRESSHFSDQVNRASTRSETVIDLAKAILEEREPIFKGGPRAPMYYKELAREVQSRGGDLSGNNPAQTLVAQLVRDSNFIRPETKGYYALRDDYPKARNVGERKRRRSS